MKRLIMIIVVVLVLAAGWFFVSPLFIDRTVDEALPIAVTTPDPADGPATSPTDRVPALLSREEVLAMTPAEREAAMAKVMEASAARPDTFMDEPMGPSVPVVVASGRFKDADVVHKGSGDATLYALPDGSHLVRFENFRVTNGPALHVYLVEHPDPTEASHVGSAFVDLGRLKGNVGNQNYPIPAGVDVDDYGSVVIWCQLFGVLFSPAALN